MEELRRPVEVDPETGKTRLAAMSAYTILKALEGKGKLHQTPVLASFTGLTVP